MEDPDGNPLELFEPIVIDTVVPLAHLSLANNF
jgi:hypothetical protein